MFAKNNFAVSRAEHVLLQAINDCQDQVVAVGRGKVHNEIG